MRRFVAGLSAFALLLAAGTAAAHDSFIVPPGPLVAGAPIRLQITSSSFFPEPESAIRPARVARLSARAGETALIPTLAAGEVAMQVTLAWPTTVPEHQNGIVVAVDLGAWNIDVSADEIDHYMDEIGAPSDIRSSVRAAVARDGVLKETYTKHLKLMTCIDLCEHLAPSRSSGSALEFVSADESWQLLENGQPVRNQAVFAVTEAEGRNRLTTDSLGRVVLPEGLTGPVFLTAVILRAPAEGSDRFTSSWAALTLDASVLGR